MTYLDLKIADMLHRSRKEHLERARNHEREGNRAGAHECYQRAVDITPALAARLIKVIVFEHSLGSFHVATVARQYYYLDHQSLLCEGLRVLVV
jgi:hypothetical protein